MKTRLTSGVVARLRTTRGESITEVLVAILVAGLAVLMLATVIAVAANSNAKSRDAMNEYFAANNNIAAETVANGTGSVSLADANTNETVRLSTSSSISVNYYISEQYDDTPIATYDTSEGAVTP